MDPAAPPPPTPPRMPGYRPPPRLVGDDEEANRAFDELVAARVGDPGEAPGAGVLDDVESFLAAYVAFPTEHARVAVTLWAAHSHAVAAFESSPRLALLSPEPSSGKTRALEVLDLLCPQPMHVLSASAAAIFRSVEKAVPTLLFDEIDSIFGRRGKDDSNEDLRALLNAGHRRGATIPRCVGPTHDVRQFKVYAAVALAGLGDLPDTLMARSVVIRMRRRAPHEQVTPFRHRVAAPAGHALRDRLGAWADATAERLGAVYPDMPDGVTDRPADVWEPLLAVADAAAGTWPERARAACVELTKANVSRDASLGIRLLSDLRAVFGDEDRLSTETILAALHGIEEAPWADLRGRPLDARGLARRLGGYEVASTKVRIGDASLRGYRREDLYDAWQRYCPTRTPAESGTSGTPGTSQVTGTETGSGQLPGSGTCGAGSGTASANGTTNTPSEQASSTGSGSSGPTGGGSTEHPPTREEAAGEESDDERALRLVTDAFPGAEDVSGEEPTWEEATGESAIARWNRDVYAAAEAAANGAT